MENIKFKSSILPVVLGILMLVIAAILNLRLCWDLQKTAKTE